MNDSEKAHYIALKLNRAKRTFGEAELLINNKMWNAAVNRMYYACFYAVNALLFSKDIKARKHSGVIQMFGLHFVNTGVISREMNTFYSTLFDMRQSGDYNDTIDFEEKEVVSLLTPGRQFIDYIGQILA